MIGYLLERSLAFAIVFLVMGGLWILVRHRLGAHVGSYWFLFPLVVLLLPIERWIPNPWAGSNPIERAASSLLPEGMGRAFVDPSTEGFLDFGALQNSSPSPENAGATAPASVTEEVEGLPLPSMKQLLIAAWSLGLMIYLVRLAQAQIAVRKLLRDARSLGQRELPFDLAPLGRSAGLQAEFELLESPEFDSPAAWASVLPSLPFTRSGSPGRAVVLPEGLTARLDEDSLRWVLLHELAHLARRDHLAELFQRLLGAAFCFHPLVWFSNRLTRAYREMACDEAALVRCEQSNPSRCAEALYQVVAHATALGSRPSAKHRTPHAMPLLFHSKKLTQKRIMRLVDPHPSLSRGLGVAALLPLLVSSAAALSIARFPAVSSNGGGTETPPAPADPGELTKGDSSKAALLATDWLVQS